MKKVEAGAITDRSSISPSVSKDEDLDSDDTVTLPYVGKPEDAGTDPLFQSTVAVPCHGPPMMHFLRIPRAGLVTASQKQNFDA